MNIRIVNGLIYYQYLLQPLDLAIRDGCILSVGEPPEGFQPEQIIDAGGGFVLPGFIDIHTHLDDTISGYSIADSFKSGTEVAVRNGITTLFSFVTQGEGETLDTAINKAHLKAKGSCWCHYGLHLTPTRFQPEDWESIHDKIAQGYRTFKFYTTYKHAGLYCSYEKLEFILRRLLPTGVRCLVHCEDETILNSTPSEKLNFAHPFSHALIRPPAAEIAAIRRLIDISSRSKAPIHIVHVSTFEGTELIHEARDQAPITCETAPHYLFLSDQVLKQPDGHRWICSPPLRSEENRRKMFESAHAQRYDLLATDHCPFIRKDKDQWGEDIRKIPNGIAGIGALPHLAAALFGSSWPAAIHQIATMLSENPARITGLFPRKGILQKDADADIVIFAPAKPGCRIRSSLADVYETFPDQPTTLDIRSVIVAGREVVHNNELLPHTTPEGEFVGLPS